MEHSEADASFDEFAEWRRLDAQARGIADRLLAQGSATAQRMGAQVERYAAIKASLAGQAYLEDSTDDDGDRSHWERAEWRRLTQQLRIQARHIADHLVDGGPAAVDTRGPLMGRYATLKGNLEKLSYSVAGTHSQSPKFPELVAATPSLGSLQSQSEQYVLPVPRGTLPATITTSAPDCCKRNSRETVCQ